MSSRSSADVRAASTGSALLVEDDAAVRAAVDDGLRLHGHRVTAVGSAEEALDRLDVARPDIMILDIGLPGMSGIELCERLRQGGSLVPILILSARDAVGDRVAGLQAGADDYLVKPFDLAELAARVEALLRRAARPAERPESSAIVGAGPVEVDADRRIASAHGTRLDLTRREFDLLETLVLNHRVVLSRITLLELVWGYDFDVDTNVVDVFVGYLRKKLAAAGADDVIRTVRGVGFVFEADPR